MLKFKDKYRVNFYDCDPANILFFANIFKIIHTSYEKFLTLIDPEKNYFDDPELVIPIVKTSAKYLTPIKAGEELEVEVFVKECRENSFQLNYILKKENILKAEAETIHVFVRKEGFIKTNIPKNFKIGLKSYLS